MPHAHLLVVDDEPSILTTLQKALTLEGYSVDVAGGVKVADEKLKKRSYDLCLFDVQLPDGDGITLLAQIRAAKNEVPVIMMSGHATIDTAVKATRLGALNFLEKPINTDALLIAVETALRLQRAETEARELRVASGTTGELVGESGPIKKLVEQIARAAKSSASVLVTGERGTGKELVARAIHQLSPRAKGPLEKLNCAALPSELIESELFGHEAGAFTGATKQRRGKFERASGGTLFLDEVGDMPLPMQAKLLRVLQEREIERVGGNETIKVDTRVVAATNRDLVKACESDVFRADLYDRLNVVPLHIPPLRARREDVPLLARHFLELASKANDRPGMRIEEDAIQVLVAYSFPGNVRELRNLTERLVILTPDDVIRAVDVRNCLPGGGSPKAQGLYRPGVPFRVLVEESERQILQDALAHHGGQMAATARALDLERSHLYKKARALGLRGDSKSDEEDAG
ncbi:MAG: Fis family transcriptional regulator [Myxococcales bacterium 68-20]|nr:sigma-54-dependent Fis family transcriptional regulator [Myxococcales bacterium]OJY30398.1 MAG: Fis family transcriptional regulator [Myxococcales bacterium 68-20]